MKYSYVTLTRKYNGFFATEYFYTLNFLNKIELSLNFSNEFKSFDEGVAFLGDNGYLLTNVLQSPNSDNTEFGVTKGWFAKQID